jgi:hypothetical protein
VQSELRPKRPLCNPPPRSYVILHVRRGDRLRMAAKQLARAPSPRARLRAEEISNASALDAVIRNALLPLVTATGLPLMVLSDDDTYREWAEAQLRTAGVRVVRSAEWAERCPHELTHEPTHEPTHEHLGGAAGRHATDAPNEREGWAESRILTDFFAVADAAGAVAVAPLFYESSFATVASLARSTPLLTPVPQSTAPQIAAYTKCTAPAALPSIFFLEGVRTFIERVRSRQLLPHAISSPPTSQSSKAERRVKRRTSAAERSNVALTKPDGTLPAESGPVGARRLSRQVRRRAMSHAMKASSMETQDVGVAPHSRRAAEPALAIDSAGDGMTALDDDHRRAVADAVFAVVCCAGVGCRVGTPRVRCHCSHSALPPTALQGPVPTDGVAHPPTLTAWHCVHCRCAGGRVPLVRSSLRCSRWSFMVCSTARHPPPNA